MPNIKSSIKRVRIESNRTAQNKHQRSKMRTTLKNAFLAIENQENAEEAVKNATKLLDQAANNGIISKQKAARHKSQLQKALQAQA